MSQARTKYQVSWRRINSLRTHRHWRLRSSTLPTDRHSGLTVAACRPEEAPVCPCFFVQGEHGGYSAVKQTLTQTHTRKRTHSQTQCSLKGPWAVRDDLVIQPVKRGWEQSGFCAACCTLERACVLMHCSDLCKLKYQRKQQVFPFFSLSKKCLVLPWMLQKPLRQNLHLDVKQINCIPTKTLVIFGCYVSSSVST